MKVLTFNVNGLRSLKEYYALTKKWTFDQLLASFDADIICFQETKINKPDMVDHDLAFPKDFHAYFSFPRVPRKTGYSGVVTYVRNGCKHSVRNFYDGFTQSDVSSLSNFYDRETLDLLDSESRVMMTDHGAFVLFNVYYPNDGGPERAEFRERFYSAITLRMQELVKQGRRVLVACDLNTTYDMIDHCDYVKPFEEEKFSRDLFRKYFDETFSDLVRSDGNFLMEDLHGTSFDISNIREDIPALIQEYFKSKPCRIWAYYMFCVRSDNCKMIDCFRLMHPDEPKKFTCWNTLMAARGSNYGTRIDYIIAMGADVSADPSKFIKESDGMFGFMGSDHCPMWATFEFEVTPWDNDAKEAKPSLGSTGLHKQKRLDAFFKPKPKTDPTDTKRPADLRGDEGSLNPSKKSKQMIDTKLPFGRPKPDAPPPLCPSHQEPGKLMTVNKAGPNKGRKFYVCARPVGHPTDSDAKCNFFKWQT